MERKKNPDVRAILRNKKLTDGSEVWDIILIEDFNREDFEGNVYQSDVVAKIIIPCTSYFGALVIMQSLKNGALIEVEETTKKVIAYGRR